MNTYVTGNTIKKLREAKGLTQAQLADMICVSGKAVSRWETGKGLPDISLIEPLAAALGISIAELFSGEHIINSNVSANMLRSKFYVCPVCGNIVHTIGESVISCCGIQLPLLEAEDADEAHKMAIEIMEDEYFITIDHEMTKKHNISFIAYVTSDKFEMVRLYPEGNAQTRFFIRGDGMLYFYCNHHGLMKQRVCRRKLCGE